MDKDGKSTGPLAGYRVLEFANMISGPFCGQMLADLGADVVKVESLEGDGFRALRPEHGGLGAHFAHFNRGKRSVKLDLKSEKHVTVALDLVRKADVVIDNFRPGVMKRLGLDYETLRHLNPEVVHLSITGFGEDGPYAQRPAFDQVIQAMTGFMWTQGEGREPQPIRNPVVDKVTSLTGCNAVVAALLHRERTGCGQHIGVSLLDAYAAFLMAGLTVNETFVDAGIPPLPPRAAYRVVSTRDGHVIGNIHSNAQFAGCARAFGRPELLDDPRFKDPRSRQGNLAAMWSELADAAHHRTTDEILQAAIAEGVPLAAVNTLEEFLHDPQVAHNEVFVDYHDAKLGRIRQLNFPARFSKSPVNVNARAPMLGEHTDEVFADWGREDNVPC